MPSRGPVWALVRLLPRVSRRLTLGLAVLVVAEAASSGAFAVAVGHLVGGLSGAGHRAAPGAERHTMTSLAVVAALYAVEVTTGPLGALVATKLGLAAEAALAQTAVEGALRPAGIAHLDDPAVVDQLELARAASVGGWPPRAAVTALTRIVPLRLGGLTATGLLFWAGGWWQPVVLGAAWVVTGRWQDQRVRRAVAGHAGETATLRRAAYLRDLATGPAAAKEVRVFGLQSWLVGQFTRAWWAGMAELRAAGTDWRRHLAGVGLLGAAHLAVVVPLAVAAAGGGLSPARLAVALQAVVGMAALGWIGDAGWQLRLAVAAVPPALAVGALGRAGPSAGADGGRSAAGQPRRMIRFQAVGFGYPGAERRVLDGFELSVPAGSSLALVGANGAGKSTVTKLLAGLYRPDTGRITVDGEDLAGLDPASWRRQLAVVFQDFVRYPFSARENITLGYVEAEPSAAALAAAARQSGFAGTEAALARGWDTPLNPAYTGGTDLSGGQWQRLALARALYAVRHGARVLVLDEPTAHLDVRAEHALYQRFLELTAGITTILVAHRFATVRLADRIAVLAGGRIDEYGSHDELVAAGGRYAEMFRLQARPYVDAPAGGDSRG